MNVFETISIFEGVAMGSRRAATFTFRCFSERDEGAMELPACYIPTIDYYTYMDIKYLTVSASIQNQQ
jgi:hypothetical protein